MVNEMLTAIVVLIAGMDQICIDCPSKKPGDIYLLV